MIIRQKRIRNLERHIPEQYRDQKLRLGTADVEGHLARLQRIGFSEQVGVGEAVLPAIVGPISRFNAEGKHIVRRDLPKETAYRQVEWHWTEYHGDSTVERSDFRDVPYQRYPRDFVPPPSLEFTAASDTAGRRAVVTEAIKYSDEFRDLLLHAVNLALECFGECEVLTPELVPAIRTPLTRLNWRVLPPGKYPWEHLRGVLKPVIDNARKGKRGVISRRLEVLSSLEPEFVAMGQGGFTGYIVFGFPKRNLYVLESALYGNATYVFEEDWELLSQMTEAQILNEELQKARFVHREGWIDAVHGLLR